MSLSSCRITVVLLIGVLFSCSPYQVKQIEKPVALKIPQSLPNAGSADLESTEYQSGWWREFNDPRLEELILRAFEKNYSLAIAHQRLRGAQAAATVAGSVRFPQIDLGSSASRTRVDSSSSRFLNEVGADPTQQGAGSSPVIQNEFMVRSGLSFEIDLWRRIASSVSASELQADAIQAEYENTALLLSGTIAENWFRTQELKALLTLLEEQHQASLTQLELVELRFAVGKANALDVLQQRQQLNATKIQIPAVQAQFEQTLNALSLLVGAPPGEIDQSQVNGTLPELPSFPGSIAPVDVLELRPDLRSARLRAQSAEYQLAAVIAERFPRLTLGLSYDFSTRDIDTLFMDEVGRMAGNLTLPILDGGRRRAQTEQQRSVAKQRVLEYSESFLVALRDIDNALSAEKNQMELSKRVQIQVRNAKRTLKESQARYVNGLGDYLPVLIATQSLHEIERRSISESRALLVARARLYRALGGKWMDDLVKDDETTNERVKEGATI